MAFEQITYGVDAHIATVTLNRPDMLNAWTPVMEREVRRAMAAAAADAAVRVIVLTGSGRGFCAGADMSVLSGLAGTTAAERAEAARRIAAAAPIPGALELGDDFSGRLAYFPTIPKPVIAAINGPTAGLGFVLTLFADLRLAAADAFLTTAFSRRGLIAEHGIDWMLPRLVGLGAAFDLLLSARRVGAEEALAMGLVNAVYAADGFRDQVRAYAGELATAVSPRSMRVMKRQLYLSGARGLGEAVRSGDQEMLASFDSEDFREGVAHFRDGRAPAFTGR